jgi:hypothetical protein
MDQSAIQNRKSKIDERMLQEAQEQNPVTSLTPLMWNAALVVMGACLGTGLAALAGLLVPGPYAAVLPWLALLISIEALYSRAVSQRINRTAQQRLLYTASEWIVIGIVLKFIILAGNGFATLASEAQSWLADFYNFLFEPAFLLSLITLVVVSFAVRVLAGDLAPLAMDERKLLRQMQATEERGGLNAVRDMFAGHVIAVGIGLALALALAALVSTLAPAAQSPVPAVVLLVYFVVALLLLGHTRVRAATNTWAIEGVEVEPGLGTRWAGLGLALVLGVTLVALLLAAGNPLTLFESLSVAVRAVLLGLIYFISLLWMLLIFVFQLIAYAFFSLLALLMGNAPPAAPQMQTPEQPPLEQATGSALNFPWGSALLVVLGIAAVIGAIYYLISRRLPADALRNAGGLFGLLRRRLAAFWLWLKGILARPSTLLDALRRDAPKQPAMNDAALRASGKRPSLKDMTARAIVRHYYGLLLQRGAQSGVPRTPAQTPREYAQMLDQKAPDAAPDVDQLTETFVEARYSTHDVSDQQAAAVREWFTHIRNSLRPRRKGPKP